MSTATVTEIERYCAEITHHLADHDLSIVKLPMEVIQRALEIGMTAEDFAQWAAKYNEDSNLEGVTLDALNKARIRFLNYLARTAMGIASRAVMTQGIVALPPADQSVIQEKVERYDHFTPDNDPYQENDFGAFEYNSNKVYWKIDYYDKDLQYGSEDPANPHVTARVLTMMLAHEY